MNEALIIGLASLGAALIAAIAAIAAAWLTRQNQQQLQPSNGHTVAAMIEDLWKRIAHADEDREYLHNRDAELHDELREHDDRLKQVQNEMEEARRWEICPHCLQIVHTESHTHDDDEDGPTGTPI